ncbi:MAG: hypothetical protein PHE61_00660 [Candidatus Omnitrophica bacterium]|nr:hypothetical protein [Candidatus Omnitrophota bacterium]
MDFSGLKNLLEDREKLSQLLKDDGFRKLIENPKVRELLRDESFIKAAQSKNIFKLVTNPAFQQIMQDNELRGILLQLNTSAGSI